MTPYSPVDGGLSPLPGGFSLLGVTAGGVMERGVELPLRLPPFVAVINYT